MQRYFVDQKQIDLINQEITIISSDVHHIKNVMRMKLNDEVIAISNNNGYYCKIILFNNDSVILKIIDKLNETNELSADITIAQGLTTREKREEVVQKITQLGAYSYIPVLMKKCLVKLGDNASKQTERLNKIAKEASEQSERVRILKVEDAINISELIKRSHEYDLCLIASTKTNPDTNLLGHYLKQNKKKILFVVGPEAGIDEAEESLMIDNGFIPISLGKRILRCEVAPIYIMSVASYILENSGD